jgi:NADPH-dependent glutamate synthase beta subunit-like oxidoreductase
LDFLKPDTQQTAELQLNAPITIYGGAKLAIDAAKMCKQRGADSVSIVFRENQTFLEIGEMAIEALEEQGVALYFNSGIKRLYGENNVLTAVDRVDLQSGESVKMNTGTLILASGRFPELIFSRVSDEVDSIPETDENQRSPGEPLQWVAVDPYKKPAFRTQVGLFASGDAFTDYSAAIKAIAAGRRAAASVHEIIYGIALELPHNVVAPETCIQNVDHVENVQSSSRRTMPLCDQQDLDRCKELELGFDEHTARFEAGRCLQCGLICYRRIPQTVQETDKTG